MNCQARFFIYDNYGDNYVTMKCQLAEGHEGIHEETFKRYHDASDEYGTCLVRWEKDEAGMEAE